MDLRHDDTAIWPPRPSEGSQRVGGPSPSARAAEPRVGRSIALFLLLSGFWILLSGRLNLQYMIFMVVAVGIVLALNPTRPFSGADPSRGRGWSGVLGSGIHLLRYLVWLVWNVMKANIDVAYRILHPSLPIKPRLLVFRTELQDEVARVVVANSITLTPGTVTIDLIDGSYLVHALHPDTAGAVVSGELQNIVGRIFGEGPEPAPTVEWSPTIKRASNEETVT